MQVLRVHICSSHISNQAHVMTSHLLTPPRKQAAASLPMRKHVMKYIASENSGRPHVLAVLSAVPPLRRSVWPPLQKRNYTSLLKRLHYFVVTFFLPTVAMPLSCFPSSSPRCSIGSLPSLVSSNGSPGTALGNITSKLPLKKWGRVPSGCR